MASVRILAFLLVGAMLMCYVSADQELLNEILSAHLDDDIPEKRCKNRYKPNICGKIIRPENCRKSNTRMGKFARENCRLLCGFC